MVSYKLKILSGPLFGMDIRLPAAEVFFVAGNGVSDEHAQFGPTQEPSVAHVNGFAVDSLYLPLAESAPNFTLKITGGTEDLPSTLFATLHDDASGGETQSVPFNEPTQIGKVWLAIAPVDDAWSGKVSSFRTPAPVAGEMADQTRHAAKEVTLIPGTELEPVEPSELHLRNDTVLDRIRRILSRQPRLWIAIFIASVLASVFTARPFLAKEANVRPAAQALTVAGVTALTGNDQRLYFITDDSKQTNALRRVLSSSASASHNAALIMSREDLETRIEKTLERHTVDFFKVRLHDVRNPRVLASTGASYSTDAQEAARLELLAAFPFIESLTYQATSLEEIQTYAVRALQRAGATFDISNDDPLAFLVTMPASDYGLAALREQIKDFRSRWDTRRTTFGGVSTDTRNQNWLITKEGVGVQLSKNQTLWNFGANAPRPSTTF